MQLGDLQVTNCFGSDVIPKETEGEDLMSSSPTTQDGDCSVPLLCSAVMKMRLRSNVHVRVSLTAQ